MIFAQNVLHALQHSHKPYTIVNPSFPSFFRPPLLCFSGTVSFQDVLDDLQIQRQKCSETAHVHAGFANRARRMLAEPEISEFLKSQTSVVFGGYSLGGAVAVIAAHLAECDQLCKVRAVYTFGAPAVGDLSFTKEYRLAHRTFRYTLSDDIIPRSNFRYRHVGQHINMAYNGTSVIDNHILTRYVDEVKALSSLNCMYDDMPTD